MKPNNNLISLSDLLDSGVDTLGLKITQTAKDKIIKYIDLMHKWNKVYNLTSIRDLKSILIRHIFDSLAIAPFITGPNILDFGTGAGLPGIPLALALPEWNFILLDSSHKKTNFLNYIKISLNINNIEIVTNRVENFYFDKKLDTIVTRATSSLSDVIEMTKHLQISTCQILAMKGKLPQLDKSLAQKAKIYKILVPYLNEERHLIKMEGQYL